MYDKYPSGKAGIVRLKNGMYVPYVVNYDNTKIKDLNTGRIYNGTSTQFFVLEHYNCDIDWDKRLDTIMEEIRAIANPPQEEPYDDDPDVYIKPTFGERLRQKIEDRKAKQDHKKFVASLPHFSEYYSVTYSEMMAVIRYYERQDRLNGCGRDAYLATQAEQDRIRKDLDECEDNIKF